MIPALFAETSEELQQMRRIKSEGRSDALDKNSFDLFLSFANVWTLPYFQTLLAILMLRSACILVKAHAHMLIFSRVSF
jgi:hypothetical protein